MGELLLSYALAALLAVLVWREVSARRMPRNLDPRPFVPSLSDDGEHCYTCARGRWLVFFSGGEEIFPYRGRPCACDWFNHWWWDGWRPGPEWTGPIMGACGDWGRGR